MNITKSSRLILISIIITLIVISVFISVSFCNRNRNFMKFISLGVTTGSEYSHQVYIKLLNEENLNDTIDVIITNGWLMHEICFDKRIDTSDPYEARKFKKQFLKDLAYCIRNDKPMIVSSNVFNEFNNEIDAFTIDENIESEFNLNGCEYYIDDAGCIKGYKWDPRDSIPNPPLNDSARINRLNNLIYLLQKERIGVYSYHDDEAPDYWGYAVWRY